MSSHYDVLGLSKEATLDEIKTAYKTLARTTHPDKGGDPEQFKRISAAYEVLSDPERRRNYDTFGDDEPSGQGFGGVPMDIFSQMFSAFGFPGKGPDQGRRQATGSTFVHELHISLQEAFFGCEKTPRVRTERHCQACSATCSACNGSGHVTERISHGPFVQIMQSVCKKCSGSTVMVKPTKGCSTCSEKGVFEDFKEVIAQIPKGVDNDYTIKFDGLGGQSYPGQKPGDLMVKVRVDSDPVFKRDGEDLVFHTSITLKEALVGTQVTVPMFDGTIAVDTTSVGVIRPGQKHRVKGKGMTPNGKLVVVFDVQFPKKLPDETRAALQDLEF